MSPEQIAAAQDAVAATIETMTQLFGGNMILIFSMAAVLAVWGVLAFLARKMTHFR